MSVRAFVVLDLVRLPLSLCLVYVQLNNNKLQIGKAFHMKKAYLLLKDSEIYKSLEMSMREKKQDIGDFVCDIVLFICL